MRRVGRGKNRANKWDTEETISVEGTYIHTRQILPRNPTETDRLNAVSNIVIAADDNDVGIPTQVTNDGRKWVYHIEWAGDGRHGCDTNENCTYTKTELDEWAKQMGKKVKTKPNCINCTINFAKDNRDRVATQTDGSYTKRKTAQEKPITQSKHKTKNTAVSPQIAWEEVKRQGELTIYSDGSVKNAGSVGTYACMAGYHDQTGKFNSIIEGGGKEHVNANPMRGAINSTRMESCSRLRAQPIIRQYWQGKVTHYVDNESAVWGANTIITISPSAGMSPLDLDGSP